MFADLENGKRLMLDDFRDGLGIRHEFVNAPGSIRTNVKIHEADTGIMTEVNQPAPM